MADYLTAAKLSDLAPGAALAVEVGGKSIALFNVGGEVYALDNRCLHAGGPLGQDELDNDMIICPWHNWEFNVKTGSHALRPEVKTNCFEGRVEGDNIQVAV